MNLWPILRLLHFPDVKSSLIKSQLYIYIRLACACFLFRCCHARGEWFIVSCSYSADPHAFICPAMFTAIYGARGFGDELLPLLRILYGISRYSVQVLIQERRVRILYGAKVVVVVIHTRRCQVHITLTVQTVLPNDNLSHQLLVKVNWSMLKRTGNLWSDLSVSIAIFKAYVYSRNYFHHPQSENQCTYHLEHSI